MIHVKLFYVWECLLVATASRWVNFSNFVFESDFKNVVRWFSKPWLVPCKFQNTFWKYVYIVCQNIQWSISHIRGYGNEAVDVLARISATRYLILLNLLGAFIFVLVTSIRNFSVWCWIFFFWSNKLCFYFSEKGHSSKMKDDHLV